MRFSLLIFLISAAGCSLCEAGIHFDKPDVTLDAELNADNVQLSFKFTNDGNFPLIIKSVKPSCGCTTADADKKIYLPGETGSIKANVTIGNLQGQLDKSIAVETNDADHPVTKIVAHIMVPRLVSFSANPYVLWDQGADAKPQTVKVKVEAPFPMKITGIKSWHDKVHAALKEVVAGKEYEITVWPTDTKDILNTSVELLNDVKPQKKIWLLVHVKSKSEP